MTNNSPPPRSTQTLLTHLGRHPDQQHGLVNTPVSRGSTILFPNLETLQNNTQEFTYGRRGTPSSKSVEDIITALEHGVGTRLAPSGLAALTCALMSVLSTGDEVLISDVAYEPTRQFCDHYLSRMGVKVTYFDPRIGAKISALITKRTKAILIESPGSLTFELSDLPAIAEARAGRDIAIIADNTWATPLFYKPLELGADISVHAGTKMFVGHSDAMFGTLTANASYWTKVEGTHGDMGLCAAPDDCFLAARGLRTLSIRMAEHQKRALQVAHWLHKHPLVRDVLHPALPAHPDHGIFNRDFSGSGSLFSFTLPKAPKEALAAMLDPLELFGMGYSWGGFESLILPVSLAKNRTITKWSSEDQIIRVHIGLEDTDELIADLSAGLERYGNKLSQ